MFSWMIGVFKRNRMMFDTASPLDLRAPRAAEEKLIDMVNIEVAVKKKCIALAQVFSPKLP